MITFTGKGILGLATYSHSGTQPVNQPPTDESRRPSIGGGYAKWLFLTFCMIP